MTIAIDYDLTWTADVILWRDLVVSARRRGHTIVMVTGRRHWSDDMARAELPSDMPIVYAGDELKETAARRAGYLVDVWIDDAPGVIQPPRVVTASPDASL